MPSKGCGKKGILTRMSQEEYDSCLAKPMKLENPLICSICNTSYTSNIDFGVHSLKHKLLYECHMCESFSHENKTVFKKHIRDHEGTTKFKCPVCEKPFQTLKVAYEHRFVHENKKPFECDLCGKQFFASYSLKIHKKKKHFDLPVDHKKDTLGHKIDRLYCKLCNKQYRNRSGMSYHNFRKHKDVYSSNPVLCDICGLDFPNGSKLKRHMNGHMADKQFSCEICSKSFTQASTLNLHIKVKHIGAKRYACNFCGKEFPFHAAYSYHLKLHTGEKPHGCLICEKKFISMGNLTLHMKKFHKCTT